MDVVGHYDECVELISMEARFAVVESLGHNPGYFRLLQVERTGSGVIKKPVHGYKSLARSETGGREDAAGWKASMQSESDKQWMTHSFKMGKAAFVHHLEMKWLEPGEHLTPRGN